MVATQASYSTRDLSDEVQSSLRYSWVAQSGPLFGIFGQLEIRGSCPGLLYLIRLSHQNVLPTMLRRRRCGCARRVLRCQVGQ